LSVPFITQKWPKEKEYLTLFELSLLCSRDEEDEADVKAHEADEEVEVHINRNAKKIFLTSQNTKTNKSVSDSRAVEKVLYAPFETF
jgi:hypothetical protein